jgi:hypothetical protein
MPHITSECELDNWLYSLKRSKLQEINDCMPCGRDGTKYFTGIVDELQISFDTDFAVQYISESDSKLAQICKENGELAECMLFMTLGNALDDWKESHSALIKKRLKTVKKLIAINTYCTDWYHEMSDRLYRMHCSILDALERRDIDTSNDEFGILTNNSRRTKVYKNLVKKYQNARL